MAFMECRIQYVDDTDPFSSTNSLQPTQPPTYKFLTSVPLVNQLGGVKKVLNAPHRLEDCTLQLYIHNGTHGEYGIYLDIESSIAEQSEELKGFSENTQNAILLRTQLTVRVHSCIETLLNANGQELQRALSSLKRRAFQDDEDFVYEFVSSDGLECLVQIGKEFDQNYQHYILRALGQVMLYVDGMEGIMSHPGTVQWLYTLTSSKFRFIAKMALKLLLVFVEYKESNTMMLMNAIGVVDMQQARKRFENNMTVLSEKDCSDKELLSLAKTFVNRILKAIPNEDIFSENTDSVDGQFLGKRSHSTRMGQERENDVVKKMRLSNEGLTQEEGERESLSRDGIIRRKSDTTSSKGGATRVDTTSFTESVDSLLEELQGVGPSTFPIPDLGYASTTGDWASEGSSSLLPLYEELSVGADWLTEVDLDGDVDAVDGDPGLPARHPGHVVRLASNVQESEHVGQGYRLKKLSSAPQSEDDPQWEKIEKTMKRPLRIQKIDFTDLTEADDNESQLSEVFPGSPTPPTFAPPPPPPPPPPGLLSTPPPSPAGKKKETVKLRWTRSNTNSPDQLVDTIWSTMDSEIGGPVKVDSEKLEQLFEVRQIEKKEDVPTMAKPEVIKPDARRWVQVQMKIKFLRSPDTVKTDILKFDETAMDKERIKEIRSIMKLVDEGKLLNDETSESIRKAQEFVRNLNSTPYLEERLNFLTFKLDFETTEHELAKQLFDLKDAIEELQGTRTLKYILATTLSIGNVLNGSEAKSFEFEYLTKIHEVRDTSPQELPLLHHLTSAILEKFPDATDFYSEIGTCSRCAKVDWDEVSKKLAKLEAGCKASLDLLRLIAKHESKTKLRSKLSKFLVDCAERIIVMKIVHQRLMNRFNKFLLYLGYTPALARDVKIGFIFKTLSEFALVYRTEWEKLVQRREKTATEQERKKTRGKMIAEHLRKEKDHAGNILTNSLLSKVSTDVPAWNLMH